MSEFLQTASPSFGASLLSVSTHISKRVKGAVDIFLSSIEVARICQSSLDSTGHIEPKRMDEIKKIIGIASEAN